MKIQVYCHRCERALDPKKMVWLELSNATNRFTDDPEEIPEDESQGMFTFGAACARAQLKEDKS